MGELNSAPGCSCPKGWKWPGYHHGPRLCRTKEHRLERFAQAFAAAGFVVLVHDHRNFGTSGGDLRGDVDPWRQIADWRRAISYLEGRPEVDPSLLGVSARKGTSCTLAASHHQRNQTHAAPLIRWSLRGKVPVHLGRRKTMSANDRVDFAHLTPSPEPASSSSSGRRACGRDRMKTAFCVFDTQARCPR